MIWLICRYHAEASDDSNETIMMMMVCVFTDNWMNEMNDRISGNHADAGNYYAGRAGSDGKVVSDGVCVWWKRQVCCVLLYLFDISWQFVPRVILPDVKFYVRVHCWTRAPRLFKQIMLLTGFRVSPRWLYPPGTYSVIRQRELIKCLLYDCFLALTVNVHFLVVFLSQPSSRFWLCTSLPLSAWRKRIRV